LIEEQTAINCNNIDVFSGENSIHNCRTWSR